MSEQTLSELKQQKDELLKQLNLVNDQIQIKQLTQQAATIQLPLALEALTKTHLDIVIDPPLKLIRAYEKNSNYQNLYCSSPIDIKKFDSNSIEMRKFVSLCLSYIITSKTPFELNYSDNNAPGFAEKYRFVLNLSDKTERYYIASHHIEFDTSLTSITIQTSYYPPNENKRTVTLIGNVSTYKIKVTTEAAGYAASDGIIDNYHTTLPFNVEIICDYINSLNHHLQTEHSKHNRKRN